MRRDVHRFGFRNVLGAMAIVAGVGMAFFVFTPIGGGASANSFLVTVTTVEADDSSSQSQAEALSDGEVSDVEMRATLHQVVECVDDEGHDAELVEFNPGLGWQVMIDAPTEADAERASAVLDACTAAHGDVLDAYWSENRLTSAQQAEFESLVRECLVANGVELIEGRSLAASVPVRYGDRFTQCQQDALAHVR